MDLAVDLVFCKQKSVQRFKDTTTKPFLEFPMPGDLSEKTRVPLIWFFLFIAFSITVVGGLVGGAVLYVTDIKTNQAVDSVRISNLDSRVNSLESSWSGALQEIKRDLKDLATYVNERERGEKSARGGHK